MEELGYMTDPAVVTVALAILTLGAWRIGIGMGRQLSAEKRAMPQFDGTGVALLALLLAFAFGTSMSKYEQRRVAVLQDSNAIGDFYTCATLLREPTRSKLQALIRAYAEERLRLARQPPTHLELERALSDFQRMHQQMTTLVAQALADGTPIAVSLTNTLNALTSSHSDRLAALRDHLPGSILALLFVSTIITTTLIGRSHGFSGTFDPTGIVCFVLIVSFVFYVTLDLNLAQRGFIKVSQEPVERLISSMTQ